MSNQTGIKKQILKELSKNKSGLTNFELSEKLGLTKQQVNDSLRESSLDAYVLKGESLGVEGINYSITSKGLSYSKSQKGEKSPLAQPEKAPVETVKPAPIVVESALESDRINPIQESALHDFEKHLDVVSDEPYPTPVTSDKIENVIIKDLNPKNFVIRKAVDDAAEIIISHYESLITKREIDNFDYKIATLESLADIYNPKISATLREIAADLRG